MLTKRKLQTQITTKNQRRNSSNLRKIGSIRIKHIQNRETKQTNRQEQLFDSNNKSKWYRKRIYSGPRITNINDAGGRKH